MIDESDIVDVPGASALLKLHEETIRTMAREGTIPAFKAGRVWRFHRQALLEWSEAQKPDQIRERAREKGRLQALWGVAELANADTKTINDHVLQTVTDMTDSQFGFYGFMNQDESVMTIHSWNGDAMKDCEIDAKPADFHIEESGVWTEALRARQPFILNDYAAAHPAKKGLPAGHVMLTNLLVVPSFSGDHITSVVAVANCARDYNDDDVAQVSMFLASIENIVAVRRAKDAAEESDRKYRALFENMVQGVFYQKADGTLVDCNPAALRMFGLTKGQFLGRDSKHPDWKVIKEDGTELPGEQHPSMRALARGQTVSDVVGVFNPIVQDFVWLNVNAMPEFRADESRPYQVFVTMHDITERVRAKKKDERQKYYLEKSQELGLIGTWDIDVKQDIVRWTDENCKIFGVPPGTEATYEIFLSKVHPDDRDYVNQAWTLALQGAPYDIEHRLLIDGVTTWVREKAEVTFDNEGRGISAIGFTQDITERKRVEEELKVSESRFRTTFESSAVAMGMIDPDGRFVSVNQATCDLLGYTTSEFLDLTFADVTHPNDIERSYALFIECLDKKAPYTIEKDYVTKDGTVKTGLTTVSPIFAADGTFRHAVAHIKDITERRQAEYETEQARNALEEAQMVANMGSWEYDVVADKPTWSAQMFKIFSLDSSQEVPCWNDHQAFIHPDDWDILDHAVRSAVTDGTPYDIKYRFLRPDGEVRWGHSLGRVKRDASGAITHLAGTAQDITEHMLSEEALKASESRFHDLFENAPLAYQSLDQNGNFLAVNQTWCEILGYPKEEVLGHNFSEFITPECHSTFLYNFPCFRERGYLDDVEFEIVTKSGERRQVAFDGRVGRNPDGSFKQTHCIFRDITETKRAQQALIESEHRFHALFEQAGDYMFLLEVPSGGPPVIADANEAACRIHGYTREELVGKPIEVLDAALTPNDKLKIDRAISQGETLIFETLHKRKDGTTFPVEASLKRVTTGTGTPLVFSLERDITQRKQMEAERETALARAKRREQEEAALLSASRAVLDDHTFEQAARHIFDTCSEIIGSTSGYVALLSSDGQENEVLFLEAGGRPCTVDPELPMPIRGLRADAYKTGKAVYDNDFWHSEWMPLMPEGHVTLDNVLFAPMNIDGKTVGIMGLANKPEGFSDDDAALASAFADFGAIALRKARDEEALRDSLDKHRSLVEAMPDIVMRFAPDGRHLFVSKSVEAVVPFPADDFIGKTHRELGFPERESLFWEKQIRRVADEERPFESEFMFDGKSGPVVYNWRLVPEYDGHGRVKSVLSIARDVTEHRQLERDYQTMFREMLDGFALHEIICGDNGKPVDYRFLAVNPAFEHITGLKAEAVLNRTVSEVMPDIEPYWIDTYGQVALTGEPVTFENYAQSVGKHFNVTAFQTAPNQFACIFVDITERKRAEQTLHSLVRTAVGVADEECFDMITRELCALLHVDCAIVGEFVEAPTGDEKKVRALSMFRDGQEIAGYEYSLLGTPCEHAADTDYCFYGEDVRQRFPDCDDLVAMEAEGYVGTPIRTKDNEVIGMLCAISRHKLLERKEWPDVMQLLAAKAATEIERKRAQEAHRAVQEQLRQAQKMEAIGTLAGGIAHDFNNILHAILGYSEMAVEELEQNSEARDLLAEVNKAAQRGAKLVGQILAMSRKKEQEYGPVLIQTIVEETLRMLRGSLPSTIEILEDIDQTCGSVMADTTEVHQIVLNLCTNAYLAMREQGGTLSVSVSEVELTAQDAAAHPDLEAKGYIKLVVSDTGHGIKPAIIDRIFEPYFTTRDTGEGTGLGLATVHGIIRRCGGAILVKSELDHGTTFSIFFPLAAHRVTPQDAEDRLAIGRGHGECVLAVDDEESITRLQRAALVRMGYRVETCVSPLEALEAFEKEPEAYDIVITDQTMPRMTGVELSKRLLQIRPDIPIILCTGHSELTDEKRAMALGIRAYFRKPTSIRELAKAIRLLLDGDEKWPADDA